MKLHVYLFVIPLFICFFLVLDNVYAKSKISSQEKTPINEESVYLDIEDDQNISMFNIPGENWKSCDKNQNCKPVLWPNNKSEIIITGPKQKHKVIDPYTNELVEEEYYPVKVKYSAEDTRAKNSLNKDYEYGFIEASYLKPVAKKKEAFYTEKKIHIKDSSRKYHEGMISTDCQPKPIDPRTCGINDTQAVIEKYNKDAVEKNKSINDDADILLRKVGKCVSMPSQEALSEGHTNYDKYALKKLDLKNLPEIKNENGKKMSPQDLINIDSLARTLFGEGASCFKEGLQHPMSVARVATNRIDSKNPWFIQGNHIASKPKLSKICTTGSQFNTWNSFHKDRETHELIQNPSLANALCPVKDSEYEYAAKRNIQTYNISVWKNAVRIATEAVLYPKKFKIRTDSITKNITYYTSKVNFKDVVKKEMKTCTKEVVPKVEGRELVKKCVRLWTIPCENKNEIN